MKITAESTPNPATLTFRFSQPVLDRTLHFETAAESERSPLASKIFGFPWTSRISLGEDHISVTKQDWVDWEILAQPLTDLIQEHFDQNLPVLVSFESGAEDDASPGDSDVVQQIKTILRRDIRPVVALDGGDIVFAKYEDHKLYVHMKGSCQGCPSSQATLKDGIEARMKELLPEITEVISI